MEKTKLAEMSEDTVALSDTAALVKACSEPVGVVLLHRSIDQRLHELGHASRGHFEGLKSNTLELAICIWEAKVLLMRTGRGSGMPGWLAEHLPTMERKTADRLASIPEAFAVNADNVSAFRVIAERIRLTALYQLSAPGVPEEARTAAMAAAQAGETISVARATEIVKEFTIKEYLTAATTKAVSRKRRTRSGSPGVAHEKTIELPSGTVKVSINHDDFARALHEALHELGDDSRRDS